MTMFKVTQTVEKWSDEQNSTVTRETVTYLGTEKAYSFVTNLVMNHASKYDHVKFGINEEDMSNRYHTHGKQFVWVFTKESDPDFSITVCAEDIAMGRTYLSKDIGF